MPEFVRVWGNNGIREVPVIQGVQEVLGSRVITGSTGAQVIAQTNIPFLIMPGDGSANGCQFTGTAGGAFTLTAAILANIGVSLAGCYAYFSANFGGSSLPAGWYWTEFSSDTAGIVYANTYTSGKVKRPVTKTAITPNLSGWVTGTTAEITGPTGFILPGTALGKNGRLEVYKRLLGSTSGTKSYRVRGGDVSTTQLVLLGSVTSPVMESLSTVSCVDSHTVKFTGRNATSGNGGVGESTNVVSASYITTTFDTSIDQVLNVTLQQSTNVSTPVLMGCTITATYGE